MTTIRSPISRRFSQISRIVLPAGLLLLSACATPVFEKQDGAPARPTDVNAIPDAVPRVEPRSKYGNPPTYEVFGQRYHVMEVSDGFVEQGIASWYGTKFHNQRTSSGETYDMYAMTAAHKNLPLPTYARVTNLENGRSVIVKVNDRGPFAKNRVIDLSFTAATRLGIIAKGTGFVEIRALDPRHPQTPLPAGQAPGQHANVYLQVGSYTTRDKAERMLDRVNRALPVGAHIAEGVATQRTYYRVRIGPISSVAEADKIAAILTESGIEAPRVVAD
ncbi:MAG: rare lipoprotein A [Gammaproteobacteria bacterium]|nr:MAG: rare lipoprotein A [Gammaproteobacteria bacterium]TND06328.1 MAG: rare lipoprotein A [Gammaproteobacteria bacterium]